MLKKVLIAVAVALLLIVILGLYFIFLNYGKNSISPSQNENPISFEIQGMKVEILKQGTGVAAKSGDWVATHYSGTLLDGIEFDSSVKRNIPFSFQLGQDRVIKGWDLGISGMKIGERRRLTIPHELAYGVDGFPPTIPQKATLIYEVELLGITPQSSPPPAQ